MGIELYYRTDTSSKNSRSWKLGMKAFPGGETVWVGFMYYMERKYLPSLPSTSPLEEVSPSYHSRLLMSALYPDNMSNPYLQQIWDLQLSPKITQVERITMLSMMDNSLFHIDDSPEVLDAWEKVGNAIGGQVGSAFNRLAIRCRQMIDSTGDIETITVHWNSYVNFHSNFGFDEESFFNCVADADAIAESMKGAEALPETSN